MGHFIRGFIARDETTNAMAQFLGVAEEEAAIADLPQGFQLFFMTDFVIDAVSEHFGNPGLRENSYHLTDGMVDFVRHVYGKSKTADGIAYIETDYFGGDGTQYAAVFGNDGIARALFLPENVEVTEKYPNGPLNWPINTMLREIGVVRNAGMDEFDTLELGEFRHMPEEPGGQQE